MNSQTRIDTESKLTLKERSMGKYTKWLFAINEIEGLKKCKNKTRFHEQ